MKKYFTTLLILFAFAGILSAQDKTASLAFDGVDDKVVIERQDALDLRRSPFTIEAWISADTALETNNVLAPIIISKKGPLSTSQDGFLFGLADNGRIALQLEGLSLSPSGGGGGGGGGVSAMDLRDGLCHHIAWTREVFGGTIPDTVNGYQDGSYVRRSRLGAQQKDIWDTTANVWIGGTGFNTGAFIYWFQGMVKEIRIWDHARTDVQISGLNTTHLNGNETGLLFYWRLNENNGNPKYGDTAYDCGPIGAHGIIEGPAWATFPCDNMSPMPASTCIPDTSTGGSGPSSVSSEKSESDEFSIYPNPASDELRIVTNSELNSAMLSISDLTGRIIYSEIWRKGETIDISSLKPGLYSLRLVDSQYVHFQTLLNKQ